MRRALVILAALALAACRVDVEGAPCGEPGSIDDCPSGQACGNDLRCSERAMACAAAALRCTPGATRCEGAELEERAEECTGDDPVCGAWVVHPCTSRGLVCGTRSAGRATCECPSGHAGPEFAADPAEGSPAPGESPFPTGATSPPECRFKRLGDAVAAAGAVAGPAAVRAHGAEAAEVVFGDETSGDGFPLVVAANVTVRAAEAPAGATVLRAEGATAASLVALQGRIERIRIESIAATGTGVAMSCGTAGKPSLDGVTIDGGSSLTKGVDVAGGACGADLVAVDVRDVEGPALGIVAGANAPITVSGGKYRDSGVGIRATGGKLTLGPGGDPSADVEVTGNSGDGIVLEGSTPVADVALAGVLVSGNGGTGVVVDMLSDAAKVSVQGCEIRSNGSAAPRSSGGRSVGGVFALQLELAPFTFLGNAVYANAGDQLTFESSGSWSIAATGCGSSSNVFACVAQGSSAVRVVGGGTVAAQYTVWPAIPSATWLDGNVVTSGTLCNGVMGAPVLPACP